jgi:uncharacterized protein (DUF2336 family)
VSEAQTKLHDLDYDAAKTLAADPDERVRAQVAARSDVQPEILFFLANDGSSEVRREIAANAATPAQADALLSRDGDPKVRASLAAKIARVLPDHSPEHQLRAGKLIAKTLATLARDEIANVRAVLADALKHVANAPPDIVKMLARDPELTVCEPVLRFSPLLGDAELIELVQHHRGSLAVTAIARRDGLGAGVSDAIVAIEDEAAVAALLANQSAQIREETLDRIVDAAPRRISWHAPLVDRPSLPPHIVQRMTGFVAESLLERLEARSYLDPQTRKTVATAVRQRLALKVEPEPQAELSTRRTQDQAMRDARALHSGGALNEASVQQAVLDRDRPFVRASLVVLSGLSEEVVDRIVTSRSARGLVGLCWKAGLTPRLALQIQLHVGAITPQHALAPRDGDWPMTSDEMEWHIAFFGG